MSGDILLGLAGIFVVILGALITVLINVFVALQKNTDATDRLIGAMDKQDARLDHIEGTLADHADRIKGVETIHHVKGCDRREG